MDKIDILINIEKKIFEIYSKLLDIEFNNGKETFESHNLWIELEDYIKEEDIIIEKILYDENDNDDKYMDISLTELNNENKLLTKTNEVDDISFSKINDYDKKEEYIITSRIANKIDNMRNSRNISLKDNQDLNQYLELIAAVGINELYKKKVDIFTKHFRKVGKNDLGREILGMKYSLMFIACISKFNYDNINDIQYLKMYDYDDRLIEQELNYVAQQELLDVLNYDYSNLTDQELQYNLENNIELYYLLSTLEASIQICDRNTYEKIYYEIYKYYLNDDNVKKSRIATNEIKKILNKHMRKYNGVQYEKRKRL